MFTVEFQDNSTRRSFGKSEHPDRASAENHAIKRLIELGEHHDDALDAVKLATNVSADASRNGHAVRIF